MSKLFEYLPGKKTSIAATTNAFLILTTLSQLRTKVDHHVNLVTERQADVAALVLPNPFGLVEQAKYDAPQRDQTNMFIAGSVALTAFLYSFDQQSYDALDGWKRNSVFLRKASPIVTELGEGVTSLALFGGVASYGLLANDQKTLKVGKLGVESFLVSGIIVQVLKHSFGRERPNVASKPRGVWNGPLAYFRQDSDRPKGTSHFDALPSGHVATVFAAATTIADASQEPWVPYVSYSIATLVAFSRVTEQTHWMSDCVLGGLIGVLSARLVKHWNVETSGISIHPLHQGSKNGIMLIMEL